MHRRLTDRRVAILERARAPPARAASPSILVSAQTALQPGGRPGRMSAAAPAIVRHRGLAARPELLDRPRAAPPVRWSSSSPASCARRHRAPGQLRAPRIGDRAARPSGGRDRWRRGRPASRAARSGNRACTSRRCRRRAGCRRRPRARRSDGSRGLLETRKSDSRLVKVAPLGVEHVARHLPQVEQRGEEVVAILRAERARLVPVRPAGHGRAEVRHHRHQVAGARMAVDDRVRLAVDAAVDRVDRSRRAARAAGARGRSRSGSARPTGVKATSTGLSMPPVITGSISACRRAGAGRCATPASPAAALPGRS